jgi:ribosomal protein S18 acetylase RimI-like enzyme
VRPRTLAGEVDKVAGVATLEQRAHANLADFTRLLGRLQPKAEMLDQRGVVAVRGRDDFPSARMALRADDDISADDFASAIDQFLLAEGKTACVSSRVGADDDLTTKLLDAGFQEYGQTPEMVCESRLGDQDPGDGVTVRLATAPEDVRAYAHIAGSAFRHLGMPEEITAATINNADVMLEPEVAIAIAEVDGRPVAGACSILFGTDPTETSRPMKTGYVGWVACLDEARGRGLGDVVTRRVTNEAFDRGATLLTLEASRFGESTYARMGYRELYRYRLLIKI